MPTVLKVALAAAAGAYASEFIKPHLDKFTSGNETLAKLSGPVAVGVGAAGVYWVIGKVG